jgi:uncharacterized damage-inducible protein DinB
MMLNTKEQGLLGALLDSWDRNNAILVNLLRLVPEDALGVSSTKGGPSIAKLFHHVHYVRLIFVTEDAPEFGAQAPEDEWIEVRDRERMAEMLNESAKVVREVVKERIETGQAMKMHFDHPILFLQQMIWHEGYHHGQIKLALKLAGQPIRDEDAGPGTWGVWMRKTK